MLQNDIIELVRNPIISENSDLFISKAECFDIRLRKTNEVIGVISYRYHNIPNYIDYGGNINYRIKKQYRNHGYAKMALSIMLNLLKYNTKYDEPLFVASPPTNKNYLAVAESLGGKIIHNGIVPKHVLDSYYDKEMKNVVVYQFDIEKINEKRR